MQLKSERQYLVEVRGCPRCGGDHVAGEEGMGRLLFWPLSGAEGREDLWAFCPDKNEPILISGEDID